MESFYGGRQGHSINIVRAYKTIDGNVGTNKDTVNDIHAIDAVNDYGMINDTNPVDVGQYVVINADWKRDPNHGAIYRKTFEGYDYIGQMAGPQGEGTELEVLTYAEAVAAANATKERNESFDPEGDDLWGIKEYNTVNSLVPGYDGNGVFKDTIKYAYGSIVDEHGNLTKCVFGFEFPYLVLEIEANSVDAYYNRDNNTADFANKNLIDRVDDGSHPYYEKWDVKIPKGIKGDTVTNFRISQSSNPRPGVAAFGDSGLTVETEYVTTGSEVVTWIKSAGYGYFTDENDVRYFISLDDAGRYAFKYTGTNYDKVAAGEATTYEIGDYNIISDVDFSEDGTLTISYTAAEKDVWDKVVKWITDVSLGTDGKFKMEFNNGTPDFEQTLTWIVAVTIGEDGKVGYVFNTDAEWDAAAGEYTYTQDKIHWTQLPPVKFSVEMGVQKHSSIETVYQNTFVRDDAGNYIYTPLQDIELERENPNDERVWNIYNTDRDTKEYISEPLNYIVETAITDNNHLIVWYSDVAMRQKYGNYTYDSQTRYRKIGTDNYTKTFNDWHDLGDVKGLPGGLLTISGLPYNNVNTGFDIPDSNTLLGLTDAPEVITGSNAYKYGCFYNIEQDTTTGEDVAIFYGYAYESEQWYRIGSINTAASGDPITILMQEDKSSSRPLGLNEGGFWFVKEEVKSV